MPFRVEPLSTVTHGTRTAQIDRVTHINSAGRERTYFSVSGKDTADTSWEWCPPECESQEQAEAWGRTWVDGTTDRIVSMESAARRVLAGGHYTMRGPVHRALSELLADVEAMRSVTP